MKKPEESVLTRVDAFLINVFISLVLAPLDSSMMGSGATFTAAVARAFSGSRYNSGSFSRAVFCPLSKKLRNVGQLRMIKEKIIKLTFDRLHSTSLS